MIICEVNKNHLNVRTKELLTAGSQNVNTVEFRFNEAWDGLAKTATFKTSKKTISVLLNTNTTAIPWEALADAGEILAVGVFGVSGETIVLPTVWGILGKVMDAAHLGDEEKEPTPDVYQKILDELNALERPTWDAVQNKPFSTLGGGLEVDENGVLSAQGGGSANAVQYVAQSLTDEQKTQARENIGAKAATEKSAYIISKTRSYGYIHTGGMDFDGVYAQIQSGKVVMLLVDDSSTYYGVIHPSGTGAGKEIVFYNIADISDSGGRKKGIKYFGFTWRKGDDSLTEWWGNIPSVKVDETLTESGSAADAKAVGDAFNQKLDKNQGAANAGKILGVGADGIVVPQDKPSGSTVTVDDALSSTSVNPVQNKIIKAALVEKITAPATASVGQIIKVKSVDTSGKPTEWEAADLPSGGSVTDEQVNTAVSAWLTEHPEATTTVTDGSITTAKLVDGAVDAYKMADTIIYEQIFDKDEWDENGVSKAYINAQNGKEVSANTNYKATHYIPCREKTLYTHNLYLRVGGAVCYDKDKQFVGTAAITNDQFTTLPGTSYIRFSTSSGSQPQNMMICMGDTLYSEYFVGIRYCITNLDYSKTGINNSLSGDKLKDNTVGGVKLQDESVSRTKIGTLPPDKIEGIEFDNLFAAEEYQSDIASGTDTDKVLRGWLQSNGTIFTGSTQYTTIVIPCKPNTEYSMYYMVGDTPTVWSFQGRVGFRDANKKIFGTFVPDSVTFTTPEGAYEIVCTTPSVSTPYADCQKLMLVYGGETPAYVPHKTTPSWLQTNARLKGVSVLCYGDSLTQGKYPNKVAEMLGVTVVDAGIGGNTVAQMYDRVGNYGTTYDVVTLMVGTNDNGGQTSCPLGTVDDEAATDDNATSTDTSYAARLKRLLNKIKTTHRGAVYVIMPPFQHAWGATTFESVATLMGEIAKQYKMPYLDIYHLCGWSGLDAEDKTLFMSDNTHENDLGAQRIAELLAGFIKQLKGA